MQKQRTALHYAARRTLSLLDYLMVAILMPILLIGYFLLVGRRPPGLMLTHQRLLTDPMLAVQPRALLWKPSCEGRLDSIPADA